MGSNPINLAVRFILEVIALIIFAIWGWNQAAGVLRFALALGLPILAAILWSTFAVPDDPSRSGKAPVPVPGFIRLLLELGFFAIAVWALFDLGNTTWAWILAGAALVHYVISYDRVGWLVN